MKEIIAGLFTSGIAAQAPAFAVGISVGWALHAVWLRWRRKNQHDPNSKGSSANSAENAVSDGKHSISIEDVEAPVAKQESIETALAWAKRSRGSPLNVEELHQAIVVPIIQHMNIRMEQLKSAGMGCSCAVEWQGVLEDGETWNHKIFDLRESPDPFPESSYGLRIHIRLVVERSGVPSGMKLVEIEGNFDRKDTRIQGHWQLGWKFRQSEALSQARAGAYNLEKAMQMIDYDIADIIGGWRKAQET